MSIVIPAYNSGWSIAATIASAIGQTWPNTEIIVVDDGSTDDTFAIAQQFESDRVRVVRQKNQGAAAARNMAYSLATGDYIQYLDADDLLCPEKIALQLSAVNAAQSCDVLLSAAWGRFLHRPHRAMPTRKNP